MTNRTPWQDFENRALIALYFAMLGRAKAGTKYIKAEMIRKAQDKDAVSWQHTFAGQLQQRSRGSIEAKLMNASAAHRDLRPDAATMAAHGYKAWGNYQASLKDAMRRTIESRESQTGPDSESMPARKLYAGTQFEADS